MTIDPAAAYDLFTGRFSSALAPVFVDAVGPERGDRALDVGCGTGAVTRVLVDRLGASQVSAVDPSDAFVAAVRERLPGVDVRRATAEALPHPAGVFDVTVAQLVVHFLADPVRGFLEMARVTTEGGTVAACVWDNAGGAGPLSPLWLAATELDPDVRDESGAPGAREGQLVELARGAGLSRVEGSRLEVEVPYGSFDEWWAPLASGVGSGGAYVQSLEAPRREGLRSRLEAALGSGPFVARASAWCVRAVAGSRT